MCGIAGLVSLKGEVARRERLAAMVDALGHRGPDDRGLFVAGPVGMGAARLSIIDLAGGHQPLANEDESVWACQNGEIYNYRLFRAELEGAGHRFSTASDTEVLAHGYEAWGDDLPSHLRGMFAAAIWDARRQRLLLARDPLGIKPLFWTVHEGWLLFGSEIKALLAGGVPRRLDPLALHDYLTFDYVPGPRSMFEDIRKLPAGHSLAVEVASPTRSVPVPRRYWDFPSQPDVTAAPNGHHLADREITSDLMRRLEEAVRVTMVADVPVGAFLSGGLDSSVVVALMSRVADRPVETFSVGFNDASYDELPYARQVAEHFGTRHHELIIRPQLEDVIPALVTAFDEPFADSSAVAAYLVAKMAVGNTKVALSGDGGDEIFGGYVTYQADRLAGLYRRLPPSLTESWLPALARRLPASESKMSLDLKLRRFVDHARLDPLAAHGAWRMIFSAAMKDALYTPSLRTAILDASHNIGGEVLGPLGGTATRSPSVNGHLPDSLDLLRPYFTAYPGRDLLNRLMVVDAKVSLVDDMLTKVDRTSMAHSLEVRVPLLDRPLVEWMTTLPSRHKVNGLNLKVLFKRVAADLVPREIVRRPKAGFHVPVPRWLKHELKPLVDAYLGPDTIQRQGFFNPSFVQTLVDEHQSSRANHSRNLWGLLMFGMWHEQYRL